MWFLNQIVVPRENVFPNPTLDIQHPMHPGRWHKELPQVPEAERIRILIQVNFTEYQNEKDERSSYLTYPVFPPHPF